MSDILVGRQPICDRRLGIHAFELLYRSDAVPPGSPGFDGNVATATVAINSIMQIGLDQIVGEKRAFVNMTREFLLRGHYRVLPPEQVVLEVLEDVEPEEDLLQAVRDAKELGYRIALDDFVHDERLEPLIDLAELIKVEVPALDDDGLRRHADDLKRRGKTILAEKLETHEEFEFCRDAGYDLFQGFFYCKPNVVQQKAVTSNRLALLQLVSKVQDVEFDVDEIEQIVAQDVSLTFMLLKTVNSVTFALRNPVESIHQALVMLGQSNLRRCVTLLMMMGFEEKPQALLMTALVRARVCEKLGDRPGTERDGRYFSVGLLSVLDALTDQPMEQILGTMPLADTIKRAILAYEGPWGRTLQVAVACEQADDETARSLGFSADRVQEVYFDAMHWAGEVYGDLLGPKAVV
ncbi:MAG: EAL and HDOD domain-containing protein [Planctomycetota bacterium JB042]